MLCVKSRVLTNPVYFLTSSIMRLYEVENGFLDELEERLSDPWDEYCSDIIHELADSWVPVYTFDSLKLAEDDLWLAVTEPEIECKNPLEGLNWNIYQHLLDLGYELADKMGLEN